MPRFSKYQKKKRAQVVMEAELHAFGVRRATDFKLQGGFCEYVSRLILADRKRKGRLLRAA